MTAELVTIHYRRLPDRVQLFTQLELDASEERVVTFLPQAALKRPVMAGKRVILEEGAPVVWFTYPGKWHDVGRFHLRDGTFTGIYANILTPVAMKGRSWETTDLCLDVWLDADGSVSVLDQDEFQEAVDSGWMLPEVAERAREEADSLVEQARSGVWPPPEVREWTLERAELRARELSG